MDTMIVTRIASSSSSSELNDRRRDSFKLCILLYYSNKRDHEKRSRHRGRLNICSSNYCDCEIRSHRGNDGNSGSTEGRHVK